MHPARLSFDNQAGFTSILNAWYFITGGFHSLVGVPLVVIHFWAFHELKRPTIGDLGYPEDYGNPHMRSLLPPMTSENILALGASRRLAARWPP